ncbi:hypothetical protein TARUN_4722 [Trichoderma arundinaceum]|uniref:Alpha/beta hydrolase fold-3 domain-containing protein n=1 Tax=Trichoderma arundinaceum TaxID=490622 RepID=A0A395NND5_TRIAR|nr:hypothetical protein TARUN_4722 [Trichoderma arundinaceum]
MPSERPPFDPEVASNFPPSVIDGTISKSQPTDAAARLAAIRAVTDQMGEADKKRLYADPLLEVEETTIPGPRGEIEVTLIKPKGYQASATDKRPAIYFIHPGGMIVGDAYFNVTVPMPWIKEFGAITAIADKYGFDPDRLILAGSSAGGGLAASVALKARDQGFPKISAQLLIYPMLDDRGITVSHRQYFHHGSYTGDSDEFGYTCLLGDRRGTDKVSVYEAPARATDLSNLPPTYIEVGAAEPFRDAVVAYASKLWEHGVQAELMVFAGALHAFDFFAPEASVSKDAVEARAKWLRRFLKQLE